jgi:hypothetical protein
MATPETASAGTDPVLDDATVSCETEVALV